MALRKEFHIAASQVRPPPYCCPYPCPYCTLTPPLPRRRSLWPPLHPAPTATADPARGAAQECFLRMKCKLRDGGNQSRSWLRFRGEWAQVYVFEEQVFLTLSRGRVAQFRSPGVSSVEAVGSQVTIFCRKPEEGEVCPAPPRPRAPAHAAGAADAAAGRAGRHWGVVWGGVGVVGGRGGLAAAERGGLACGGDGEDVAAAVERGGPRVGAGA